MEAKIAAGTKWKIAWITMAKTKSPLNDLFVIHIMKSFLGSTLIELLCAFVSHILFMFYEKPQKGKCSGWNNEKDLIEWVSIELLI